MWSMVSTVWHGRSARTLWLKTRALKGRGRCLTMREPFEKEVIFDKHAIGVLVRAFNRDSLTVVGHQSLNLFPAERPVQSGQTRWIDFFLLPLAIERCLGKNRHR